MPKTKQLFIEYHRRAVQDAAVALGLPRPAATPQIQREGAAAWQSLTVLERAEFVRCIRLLPGAYHDTSLARPGADAAWIAARRERNAVPKDWSRLVLTAERAAAVFRTYLPIQWRVWQAAFDLETMLLILPPGGPVGIGPVRVLATNEGNAADNERNTIGNRINRLDRWANFPPVPRWQGVRKMLEATLSKDRRIARRDARHRLFRTSLPPPPVDQPVRNWLGCWQFGRQGGMSKTGILMSEDVWGDVNFRAIRKQVHLGKDKWKSIEYFDGDVRSQVGRLPLEISCHQEMEGQAVLSGSTGLGLVPPVLSAIVDDADHMYTMYLGYCPMGDLSALIDRHTAANNLAIPEPFIWMVFKMLAEAGLAMETGGQALVAPGPNQRTGWAADQFGRDNYEIVHRDLKPANVFLEGRDQVFPDYPVAQLGDFGLSLKTWTPNPALAADPNNALNVDGLNPDIYVDGGGTRGFRAPEMRAYISRTQGQPVDRRPLTSKTNVWGVGMIIHCLVTLDNRPRQSDWLGDPANDYPNSQANERAVYSARLHTVLRACLCYNPADRWNFRQILRYIDISIRETGFDLAQGMRGPAAVPLTQARRANRLIWPNDVYALGMARNLLPALPA